MKVAVVSSKPHDITSHTSIIFPVTGVSNSCYNTDLDYQLQDLGSNPNKGSSRSALYQRVQTGFSAHRRIQWEPGLQTFLRNSQNVESTLLMGQCTQYAGSDVDVMSLIKSWYFVDRASQYDLFFFISNLIHCFSVYVQYLLSSFLYMFQASQTPWWRACEAWNM